MVRLTDAITSVAELARTAWRYFLGEQTRQQRTLEAQGEAALQATQNAQSADDLNAADADLQRVHDEALARKRQP